MVPLFQVGHLMRERILQHCTGAEDQTPVQVHDPVLATAVLDRLLHYSTTLNIKGESYRLKEKRKAGLLGRSMLNEEKEVLQEA